MGGQRLKHSHNKYKEWQGASLQSLWSAHSHHTHCQAIIQYAPPWPWWVEYHKQSIVFPHDTLHKVNLNRCRCVIKENHTMTTPLKRQQNAGSKEQREAQAKLEITQIHRLSNLILYNLAPQQCFFTYYYNSKNTAFSWHPQGGCNMCYE